MKGEFGIYLFRMKTDTNFDNILRLTGANAMLWRRWLATLFASVAHICYVLIT